MRTVFNSDEVCHVWAQQNQSTGRNANSTLSFVDGVIYSYRLPIAAFVGDMVLMSSESSSITTNKHKTQVRRALSVAQLRKVVHVENLAYLSEYERHTGKDIPRIIGDIFTKIQELAKAVSKMRSRQKMDYTYELLKEKEASARILLAHKKIKKWPLPVLPEMLPTSKEGVADLVRSIAKESMLASSAEDLERFKTSLRKVESSNAPNLYLKRSKSELASAAQSYTAAMAKPLPKLKTYLKQWTDLSVKMAPVIEQMRKDAEEKEIDQALAEASNVYPRFSSSRRLKEAYRAYPETKRKEEVEAKLAEIQKEDDTQNFDSALRYLVENGWSNAQRNITALSEGFALEHAVQIAEMQKQIDTLRDAEAVAAQEKNKENLALWRAGSDIRLPYELGCLARIKGSQVQTSHGASVRVDEAIALAKLAVRVIRSGGVEYSSGEGFRVGPYRVSKIEASGRVVIGCHIFEADEVNRLIKLLLELPKT